MYYSNLMYYSNTLTSLEDTFYTSTAVVGGCVAVGVAAHAGLKACGCKGRVVSVATVLPAAVGYAALAVAAVAAGVLAAMHGTMMCADLMHW